MMLRWYGPIETCDKSPFYWIYLIMFDRIQVIGNFEDPQDGKYDPRRPGNLDGLTDVEVKYEIK